MPTPDRDQLAQNERDRDVAQAIGAAESIVYRAKDAIQLDPAWTNRAGALRMFAAITGCDVDELTIEGPDEGPYTITYTAKEDT